MAMRSTLNSVCLAAACLVLRSPAVLFAQLAKKAGIEPQ